MSHAKPDSAPSLHASLPELGWGNHFIQQLSLDEWDTSLPARVIEQHRSELIVAIEGHSFSLPVPLGEHITVGDWLLLSHEHQFIRLLERQSEFSRKAAGSKVQAQLIAANVDTLFIVSSLNNDFNLNRIERFLVLANEAKVEPVIVLTKADLCESSEAVEAYIQQIQSLDNYLMVVALNALDTQELQKLSPWCKAGKTLALLGSSGVGKSTLANLLLGQTEQITGGIREDDSKGRHTTTSRSLHIISKSEQLAGGILLDTPGMRELQLANVEDGIEETFSDIMELAQSCKFSDCNHDASLTEASGCAVQAAIEKGELPERRLLSFQKLQREDELNSASLAQRREKDKQFGKMIKSVMSASKKRKR
jgi:ribosome biogenesis GTPase